MDGLRRDHVIVSSMRAFLVAFWVYMLILPLSALGVVNGPRTFMVPLAVFALSAAAPWMWLRVAVAVVVPFAYVDGYWRTASSTFVSGMWPTLETIWRQGVGLFGGSAILDPLQTYLFIWLLLFVYWLVIYAGRRTFLWLFYNGLAIAGMSVLDGNTSVHPNASLVIVTVVFLFVLGMNQFDRVRPLKSSKSDAVRFFAPLVTLLGAVLVLAVALPKGKAAWANPFAPGMPTDAQTAIRMVGYQLDDAQLGGSFVGNDTPVLQLTSPQPTYLRGQTLTTYTGKGWTSAPLTGADMRTQTLGKSLVQLPTTTFQNLPTQTFQQTITLESDHVNTTRLLGGYAIAKVLRLPGLYQHSFAEDLLQDNIHSPQLQVHQSYTIETVELQSPYAVLEKIHTPYLARDAQIPQFIREDNLQLPGGFPKRIGTLAKHIATTSGATTEYGMVQALIQYLQTHEIYATTDVPVPGPDQDYVSQFLFQTHRGYCNNFSSALAVMLRTLGVPTRWVTGYAVGVGSESATDQSNRYIVTNDDAHSWVEVYFPTYGWVPFDPTPNFQMPFAATSSSNVAPGGNITSTPPPTNVTTQNASTGHGQTAPGHSSSGKGASSASSGQRIGWRIAVTVGGMLLLALLGSLLLMSRRIRLRRLAVRWRRDPQTAFRMTCDLLVSRLRRRSRLAKGTTLRELWPALHQLGATREEFEQWLRATEGVLYGGEQLDESTARTIQQLGLRWLSRDMRSRN